jgi:xanthine dehydrogenase accessory factor
VPRPAVTASVALARCAYYPVVRVSDIASAIETLAGRGERMALVTVVAVSGSAYRRPGARLVLPERGDPVGSVSPGCLEAELGDRATDVMETGRPVLHRFDLTGDDETELGWGLGCNGVIEVFIEPAILAVELAEELHAVAEERETRAIVTLLEDADRLGVGARLSLDARSQVRRTFRGSADMQEAAVEAARAALIDERSGIVELRANPSTARAFVEMARPPIRLLACGGGTDVTPLAAAAEALGWDVVRVPRDESMDERLLDDRTFAVVMNHAFAADRERLRALLASQIPYIGALGPRGRTQRLLADLGEHDLSRVFAPAGLDLGAEGPEEIAHSIVAEILAVDRRRTGGFLRERSAGIHSDEPSDARPAR